jgi:hypothetical protein
MAIQNHGKPETTTGQPHGTQLDQELNMESEGQLVTADPPVAPLPALSVRASDTFKKLAVQAASETGESPTRRG